MKKFFLNLKIKTKLAWGFSIMIALMIIIGATGFISVGKIQKNLDYIHALRLPAMEYLLEADRDLWQAITAERSMLFTDPNSDDFKNLIDFYEENLRQSGERWEKYKMLAETEEELKILPLYENAGKEWRAVSEKVVTLYRNAGDDATKSAIGLSLGRANEKFEFMRGYIDQLTEINQKQARKASKEASFIYRSTAIAIIAITACSFFVGIISARIINTWITTPLHKAVALSNKLARGDLTARVEERSKDETGQLLSAMEKMISNIVRIAFDVQTAAEQVSAGSEQMEASSGQISQGTAQQAASIEQISSSMEQMNSSVNMNADNARQTASIANTTVQDAREGKMSVNKAVEGMNVISEKIRVVEEIAGETKMLALNAAIEAARAGRYGKGFSVVASEIRQLSERSYKEAKQINELSTSNIRIAEETYRKFDKMLTGIEKTAELVNEIDASTNEQAGGISQVNIAIQQLDEVIQQNLAATEEMSAGCEDFALQAENLLKTTSFFKISDTMKQSFRRESDGLPDDEDKKLRKRFEQFMEFEKQNISKPSSGRDSEESEKNEGVKIDMEHDKDHDFEKY